MSRIAAFGPAAELLARGLADEIDVVIADHLGVGDATHEAVRRKRTGCAFFTMLALDDVRTVAARRVAAEILVAEPDFDQRYELLRQLSLGKFESPPWTVPACEPYDGASLHSLKGLMWLGSSLLVRSWTEYSRVTKLLGQTPFRATRGLCTAASVPHWNAPFGGKHIVVWAPDYEPADVALTAFGLEDLHVPAHVICRYPERAAKLGLRASFVGIAEAPPLLRDALAVIVADISDPASALTLAQSGVPLAIPCTSGAHEYVDGAAIYLPWNARSIRSATLVALGSNPPRIRPRLPNNVDYARELKATEPPLPPDKPLVSILLSTKDRREPLKRALDLVAAQTYPNIEVLVINDGGQPIADVVAPYSNASLVEHAQSAGLYPRLREGAARARGKYCVDLSDDDYFFPDHIARCVYALERTGFEVARTMMLVTYSKPNREGRYDVVGYDLPHRYAYDPTELLWSNNVGKVFQTRRVSLAAQLWSDEVGHVGDWDCFLQLTQLTDFPCIKVVTWNADQRLDDSNMNSGGVVQWERDVRLLFEKHPITNRPYVEERRAALLSLARWNDMSRIRPVEPVRYIDPPKPGDYALSSRRR